MSVYVGIDVHRKRSQVAVIDQDGQVLANRNVPNGAEPILKVIGGLPPGTPAAFEAACGTSWLMELLEDYGFAPHLVHPSRCKAIASAPLKNDKGRRRDLGTACPAPVAVDSPIDSRDLVSLANVRIVELSRACCQHWLSQSRIRKLSRPPQAVAGDRA